MGRLLDCVLRVKCPKWRNWHSFVSSQIRELDVRFKYLGEFGKMKLNPESVGTAFLRGTYIVGTIPTFEKSVQAQPEENREAIDESRYE